MVYIATFSHTIYFAHQPTSLPYIKTYTQTILQTHLHPTYLPDPYIPTLHTYIPTLPLQTYETLHTCTIPAYIHYTYNHYTLLCIPALSLHTPRAGSQMVRLRSAREGILCAANFIGEIIAFEFD